MLTSITTLRDIIADHAHEADTQTAIPGLHFFRSTTPTMPINCIYEPRLCIIVQGRKEIMLGTHVFTYDAEKYLIATVDLPVLGGVTQASPEKPYLSLSLALDPSKIASLLLEMPKPGNFLSNSPGLAVSTLTTDLLHPVSRLADLLNTPQDIPVMGPLIEREILYRLLNGAQGGILRQIATADSYIAQVSQAIAWIRKHYAENFDIDTLSRVAGMSAPSFHRHFRAVTMMSPIQYRTRIRLQEARKLMVADGKDAGEAGYTVGYESPSQFSREYRRMFGTPPARDTARMRQADPLGQSLLAEVS